MASAEIRFDQLSNPVPTGISGKARDDIIRGGAVTMRAGDPSGIKSYEWTLLSRPYGSTATIAGVKQAVATIVPDKYGSYRVRLGVNTLQAGEVDEREFIVRDPAGLALPAVGSSGGERGSANYMIVPGEFNKDGWTREMNERQLRSLDLRDGTLSVTVGAGDIEVVTIEWGLPMAIMECLEIVSSSSTDTDLQICADSLGVEERGRWLGQDMTGDGFAMWTPLALTGRRGAALEDNAVFLFLVNNAGAPSTYTIYTRIKAP